MQRLGENIPAWLEKLEAPPFDDPRYIDRCNKSFRADYKMEMDFLRDRWKKIVLACLAGEYGRDVRDDWQSEYPGMNPETVADLVLMQAAQSVWKLKGSRCVERMPTLKTMGANPVASAASRQAAAMSKIPPAPDYGYRNQPPRHEPREPEQETLGDWARGAYG
jgi:hypothetical protein